MPLDWPELSGFHPHTYTVRNVFRRLARKRDPWADFADEVVALVHGHLGTWSVRVGLRTDVVSRDERVDKPADLPLPQRVLSCS